jgi:hypothetical protein
MGKHYKNSQCFKEKKIIWEKSCWKHCSNSQCFVMKAAVLPHIILALFVMTCNCNSQLAQY